jgi:hypothetical protein
MVARKHRDRIGCSRHKEKERVEVEVGDQKALRTPVVENVQLCAKGLLHKSLGDR